MTGERARAHSRNATAATSATAASRHFVPGSSVTSQPIYSNSAANVISSFVLLDKILTRRLGDLKSGRLKKRLKPYRFKKGFEERRFHHFSTKELKMIVEAWQHG